VHTCVSGKSMQGYDSNNNKDGICNTAAIAAMTEMTFQLHGDGGRNVLTAHESAHVMDPSDNDM